MPFRLRITLTFLAILLVSLLVLPFLVPIPELKTVAAKTLASPGDRFIPVSGQALRVKEAGTGGPPLLLFHTFASNSDSWRKVIAPLAREQRVVAFDRPGFGLSAKPSVSGDDNPYTPAAQLALSAELIRKLELKNPVLVGSAAGASLAVAYAKSRPDEVSGLILVDPILKTSQPPLLLRLFFSLPQGQRLGPYFMRPFAERPGLEMLKNAYADPAKLTPEDIRLYQSGTKTPNWDVALWELTQASIAEDLRPALAALELPVLIVRGEADKTFSAEAAQSLQASLQQGALKTLPNCGQLPQQECPVAFVKAVRPWLAGLKPLAP